MAQERWPYRIGPIVGGIALLAYTGTGGDNTDIGAHLAGFVSGFVAGILLIRVSDKLQNKKLQMISGLATIGILVVSWTIALTNMDS